MQSENWFWGVVREVLLYDTVHLPLSCFTCEAGEEASKFLDKF